MNVEPALARLMVSISNHEIDRTKLEAISSLPRTSPHDPLARLVFAYFARRHLMGRDENDLAIRLLLVNIERSQLVGASSLQIIDCRYWLDENRLSVLDRPDAERALQAEPDWPRAHAALAGTYPRSSAEAAAALRTANSLLAAVSPVTSALEEAFDLMFTGRYDLPYEIGSIGS